MLLRLNPLFILFCLSLTPLCPALLTQTAKADTGVDNDPTLKQQLDTATAGFADRAPPEVIKNIQDAILEVEASGILERALKTGDYAPDFELPDATGAPVRLSTLLKKGPVIIAWYRGNW